MTIQITTWGKKNTPGSTNIAVPGKWGPHEDVFPIKKLGDIPHCYVSENQKVVCKNQ